MSLKVCFLSFTHRFNDNRILNKEARALAEAGFEVVHLAPDRGDLALSLNGGQVQQKYGVRIKIYTQQPGFWGQVAKFFRLYQQGIRIDADIYHCNEPQSWIVGVLFKLFQGHKQVIFDVHEHYPSHFDNPRFPKWLKWVGEPAVRFLFRVRVPWTDYLIFAKRSVASDFHGDEDKQCFIFNYAPLRLQSRRKEDVATSIRQEFEEYTIAVHIGGFARSRGWPQLLQAMALMEFPLHVLCLGHVNEGEEVLMAEAQRLGVAHRIHLRGWLPYEHMYDYLLCADIGLMLYQPGIPNHVFAFPMKMYDYMLASLPLVAPDFSVEVAPVVREEECGLLVNPAEPGQIAKALDWLCENPSLALEMGQKGREAVIHKYNWESQAQGLIEVYKGLAAES